MQGSKEKNTSELNLLLHIFFISDHLIFFCRNYRIFYSKAVAVFLQQKNTYLKCLLKKRCFNLFYSGSLLFIRKP